MSFSPNFHLTATSSFIRHITIVVVSPPVSPMVTMIVFMVFFVAVGVVMGYFWFGDDLVGCRFMFTMALKTHEGGEE